jgi:2,4-dienoyl-CoA reductase (NADPH2)
MAPAIATELVSTGIDYLVVVRGAIYSVDKTRPDFHEPPGFNVELCRAVKAAVGAVPVFLQGSVVDPGQAQWALDDGVCDAVEMTRAQIADPDVVRKLREGEPERIRPCILCNQRCQVRDARNPLVTCVGEPSSGHETEDPDWYAPAAHRRRVVIVGAGPAGLETARVAALRGHDVRVVERADAVGGVAAVAGPGRRLVAWLAVECGRAGVTMELGARHVPEGDVLIQCTGSRPGDRAYAVDDPAMVVDVLDVRRGRPLPDGGIIVFDPIGGPIGVALAEDLGERAVLVTHDHVAGNELSITGDLAPANVRLAQRGVRIERRTLLRRVRTGEVEVEDRFTGQRRVIPCAAVVDCGFRLPSEPMPNAQLQAGDCVAPRTILEAVLEGRRAAVAVDNVGRK